MQSVSKFLQTLSGQVIVASICLSILIFMIYITAKYIVENKKHFSLFFTKKDKENNKQTPQQTRNAYGGEVAVLTNGRLPNLSLDHHYYEPFSEDFFVHQIQNHRFFSAVQYKYVDVDYGFEFEIYSLLLSHKIKNESEELIEFKKLIATRFLSDCIFKFLRDTMQKYVKDVLNEYYDKRRNGEIYASNSSVMCGVIENIMHFTKTVTHLASQTTFKYKNKTIEGIPPDFVKYFCRVISKDINALSSTLSNIIYGTTSPWYIKINEILDFLELVIVYIKESVDSTLVVLNGQLQKFVDEILKEDDDFI